MKEYTVPQLNLFCAHKHLIFVEELIKDGTKGILVKDFKQQTHFIQFTEIQAFNKTLPASAPILVPLEV